MFKTIRIRKPRIGGKPSSVSSSNDPTSSGSGSSSSPTSTMVEVTTTTTTSKPTQKEDESSGTVPVVATTNDGDNTTGNSLPADSQPPAQILIAGGGIIGLLLAVALKKNLPSVTPEIYEQAGGFENDVGAGMGLYANGLRVIRDIDPSLLKEVQSSGYPYLYRRWERHDGTPIAVADESVLGSKHSEQARDQDDEQDTSEGLQTMGIRRWKLQQILHVAAAKEGIPIHFSKKVLTVETPENGMTEVVFTDGSRRQTQLLIGADGGRSAVRSVLINKMYDNKNDAKNDKPTLSYTGVTCIMGVAKDIGNGRRGISLPVSNTTHCHGAFYPTGANEQCFQFHFPIGEMQVADGKKEDSCWGNLSQQMSQEECGKLAKILEVDGWDEEKYLTPLRKVTRAVRVGFCQLNPAMKEWSFPNSQGQPRTILVGDSAHPPTPYIGQGAQQGMEDVGTLALLLKTFCLDDQGQFNLSNLHHAVKIYEKIRIPRVTEILKIGNESGRIQEKRAQNPAYNIIKEEMIQRQVFFHESLPVMFPGARHDYKTELKKEVEQMFKEHKGLPLRPIAEMN